MILYVGKVMEMLTHLPEHDLVDGEGDGDVDEGGAPATEELAAGRQQRTRLARPLGTQGGHAAGAPRPSVRRAASAAEHAPHSLIALETTRSTVGRLFGDLWRWRMAETYASAL